MEIINIDNGSILLSFGTFIGLIFFVISTATKITRILTEFEQVKKEMHSIQIKSVANEKGINDINLTLVELKTIMKNVERQLAKYGSK